MKYRRFSEHNDHEGETWNFYIPVDGNEAALEELAEMEIDSDQIWLRKDLPDLDASVVQALIETTDMGYMAAHTRLEGTLDLEPIRSLSRLERYKFLYKGGIQRLMRV